jgi:hypothetical protein
MVLQLDTPEVVRALVEARWRAQAASAASLTQCERKIIEECMWRHV